MPEPRSDSAGDPASRQAAPSGWLEGLEHVFPLRVFYEDTDASGIVYHANYLRYAERARTEMMRVLGIPHADMIAETGVAFAVRRCEIDYLRPARLEDALEVRTRITDIGAATLEAVQTVTRSGAGDLPETLVQVHLRLAAITQAGRPVRLPARVRTALTSLFARHSQD